MQPIIVTPGDIFARFTVIKEAPQSRNHRRFECRCECGTLRTVHMTALRSGLSKSCGCLRDEIVTRHGLHKSPEYQNWTHMIARCENQNLRGWENYGGRGISVCAGWRKSFELFLLDMGNRPSLKHSLDRFPNNDGNYEPGNVRWATMAQQLRNTRRSRNVRVGGILIPLVDAALKAGLSASAIDRRIKAGWANEDILLPSRRFGPHYRPRTEAVA